LISKIKYGMEHNKILGKLIPVCRKLQIVHILHLIKNGIGKRKNLQEREKFNDFYREHRDDFQRLNDMLEDDFSKATLKAVIKFRRTWDSRCLKNIVVSPQYFQKDIFSLNSGEVFLDGGAYVGDTVEEFIKFCGRGGYSKVYAWEPDEVNRKYMIKRLRQYANIVYVPLGLWKEKDMLYFQNNGTQESAINSNGTDKIEVDSIDHIHKNDRITFIKMDIEGSEVNALLGAREIIQRNKPKLAISIYHSWSDLLEVPFLIKRLLPEYKLYIRHHSDTSAETVIYACV